MTTNLQPSSSRKEKRDRNRSIWAARIQEWQQSRMSGMSWSRMKDIKYSQFLYWKREIEKDRRPTESSFLEITSLPEETGIEVAVGGFTIRLSKDFDDVTFRRCLSLLRGSS